jgi:hypothetical protein
VRLLASKDRSALGPRSKALVLALVQLQEVQSFPLN